MTRICTTELYYQGRRFEGARLPIDVLEDLPALRDLIVIFSKEAWLAANQDRKRIPRNLIDGLQVSLVTIEDGSALPQLEWEFPDQQTEVPDIATQSEVFIQNGYNYLANAIQTRRLPKMRQPSNANRALYAFRRFGRNLKVGEKIGLAGNFTGKARNGQNVIDWDETAKAEIERSLSGSYTKRIEIDAAEYLGGIVDPEKTKAALRFDIPSYNRIEIELPYSDFISEFHPYINRKFFLDLDVEIDGAGRIAAVQEMNDYERQQHHLVEVIETYRTFDDGWLDGHGKSVSREITDTAIAYLDGRAPLPNFYGVAPTEDGGILLEYQIGTWDYGIEFTPSGDIEFFGVDHGSDGDLDQTVPSGAWDVLNKLVENTLKVGAAAS